MPENTTPHEARNIRCTCDDFVDDGACARCYPAEHERYLIVEYIKGYTNAPIRPTLRALARRIEKGMHRG